MRNQLHIKLCKQALLASNIYAYKIMLLLCRGVHGVLLELLSCKPNLHTAVEVTGGNQLFHIVVDNDTVATRIVDILNKGKLGRATFMPLNRMSPGEVSYPDYGSEAVPLMKLLKFNALFGPAMKQASSICVYFLMLVLVLNLQDHHKPCRHITLCWHHAAPYITRLGKHLPAIDVPSASNVLLHLSALILEQC